MLTKTINLKTVLKEPFEVNGYLLDQISNDDTAVNDPAVVICPGGGFTFLSGREAEPIALKFNSEGYHAFILNYSLISAGKTVYPGALLEMAATIRMMHQNKEKWHIDTNRIVLVGFSAGGNIVANYNGIYSQSAFLKKYHLDKDGIAPSAAILCYPVIDFHLGYPDGHEKKLAVSKDRTYWAAEHLISTGTKPTFIWHTVTDQVVPMENTLVYVAELKKHHIPFEAHLFAEGKHGLSLANAITQKSNRPEDINAHVSHWFNLAVEWLSDRSGKP
ncbi:alpha/beta hydrolase [Sporolactobacillus pectinivorans]|uniref:alpha/beta hydrolase n=1 Tax=Sporolactobacillus pectinivorans TaxID=1591408 RepID=UPI000C266F81|nr:alpha/beta hydrolase [Sporolactobacillus pectinivorans]